MSYSSTASGNSFSTIRKTHLPSENAPTLSPIRLWLSARRRLSSMSRADSLTAVTLDSPTDMADIFPPTPTPSLETQRKSLFDMFPSNGEPSRNRDLPPTPPVDDEPAMPRRRRRPASVYPLNDPPFPQRKYTDPTPLRRFEEDTLDVDLDAYGDVPELDAPLSFVTTSTAESTTSTPSIGVYPYKNEPRIRTGAYSSESSGTYSYPTEQVGLGLTDDTFAHRPWKRDVNRLRSDSASTSMTASTSTSGIVSALRYSGYTDSSEETKDIGESLAVTMVDEGREKILNIEKLNAMGGVDALTEDIISGLSGITHLLLPDCGSQLVPILPSLLVMLAPTLIVLDLSQNDITFLPECMRHCTSLEELNLSGNPLRTLPVWLGELTSLRMLVIDGCGLQNMPPLASLASLHTLCLRRNRFVSLPSWVSQLEQLETLRVDDNPFASQWIPIVAPILASPPPLIRSVSSVASVTSMASSRTASSLDGWMSPSSSAAHSVSGLGSIAEDQPQSAPPQMVSVNDSPSRGLRKMRSAGTLFNVPDTPALPTSTSASLGYSSRAASAMGDYDPQAPRMTASRSKWGFLRKMSMNRLKPDKLSASASANIRTMPMLKHADSEPIPRLSRPFDLGEFGQALPVASPSTLPLASPNLKRGKRRSFLPVDEPLAASHSEETIEDLTLTGVVVENPEDTESRYKAGLVSIKSYLRDLFDLSRPTIEPYGSFEVVPSSAPRRPVESRASSETEESGKKFKNDPSKRTKVLREIYETERTYVRGLSELVSIYVQPAGQAVAKGETVVPLAERKIVFGGVESILTIHRDNLLPALERVIKPLLDRGDDDELSKQTAHQVGEVFRTYIAYMKQYSTYINNFDNALSRMKTWEADTTMTMNQRKRVRAFLKRCRESPKHSQINLESYLLLPIQRVPRYKLLLEDLAMCTPLRVDGPRDTLDDALNEIASLASLMNEEKRGSDSRLRLFHWQKRITSRGPSPLVQPHRKLIMDGALHLIRLVKKASTFVEVDLDSETMSKAVVPIEYIAPEPMDRPMMLILCTDLLVLVQQRNEGWDGAVDLFNVLRMATLREPASVVGVNVLRVVDNKSIYYFSGTSVSSVTAWCRAINTARRK
ncbi:RhoGEF domain-domain-containing protein [Naematelia encephala]|uniref:RhoGEF domain-domain-containing protein n=1 Tax=Naematelia encephala TaxID=71784 RepID=A0A1Y2ATR1_9TREE|nr:RhoGEF domain-domain-containing protein [Naematelia encephala]